MKRRQRRKLAILIVLLLVLASLGLWYWNYTATGRIALPDLRVQTSDVVAPPDFLFAFRGEGVNSLTSPIGVATREGQVFVADSERGLVMVFRQSDGAYVSSMGKGHLTTPIFIAFNPKDGNLYVSDRRQKSLEVFTPAGVWVKTFDPALPKAELPAGFNTKGDQWNPMALAFAPDGTMYVVDYLKGHRYLQFDPAGKFLKSVGSFEAVDTALQSPGKFQFPSSIKAVNDLVFVVDSNNSRMQVFDKSGVFQRMFGMPGLPRGMVLLPPDVSLAGKSGSTKLAVVDTLAHDVTVIDATGTVLATFGAQGSAEGSFSYPNDLAVGDRNIIFVSDTYNQRVQAWGWTAALSPLPKVLPRQPAWCLALLPLLLIPLFFRKRKRYATADFVQALYDAGKIHLLTEGRTRWFVSEADYETLKELQQDGVRLADLLEGIPYSDTDAHVLAIRFNVSEERAGVLAFAERAKRIHTEDAELVRVSELLDVSTIDAETFAARRPDAATDR